MKKVSHCLPGKLRNFWVLGKTCHFSVPLFDLPRIGIIYTSLRGICFDCAPCIWREKQYGSRFSLIQRIDIHP